MDTLAERYLGLKTITYDEVTGKGAQRIGFEQVDVQRATEYSAEDADVTLRLHRALYPKLAADEKLKRVYETIEMPVREVLFRMERTGVLVDAARLDAQSRELGQKMIELEQKAFAEAGQPFNLNSPKQIGEIFFERLKLPVVKKTPSGAPSTDEDVLEKLALDYPLPKTLLEYRVGVEAQVHLHRQAAADGEPEDRARAHHLRSDDGGDRTARVERPQPAEHPDAHARGAPDPRSVHRAAAARDRVGRLLADRAAHHGAPLRGPGTARRLRRAARTSTARPPPRSSGGDPREVTSEERRYAKTINFGLIYGMSAFGLAQQLGLERATAQAYIDSYFARYPGVQRYMATTRQTAREQGYVETVFGRRLWLPEIRNSNQARRAGAERAAINAPMQGTAADLIKLAMIAVQDWLDRERLGAKLIMQVHDELVLEVPEPELGRVKRELPELMTGVATLRVPLVVDIGVGRNWDEAH